MNRKQVVKEISRCEKNREFDKHVDPVNYDIVIKVDKDYHYYKKGFERVKYALENIFIVKPYTCWINRCKCHTKVIGKENLKGVGAAVLTCNHVYMFDCLVVKGAVGEDLFITAAPFNNQKGFLGEMMRAGGMMPMSDDKSGMKSFISAVNRRLCDGKKVLFYPEQAMWWMYRKPRPLKDGAFHFAVKNNVPLIPCFITFTGNGTYDVEGIENNDFTLNIGKPIYAPENLSSKEKAAYLKDKNFEEWKKTYENFYGKELSYD